MMATRSRDLRTMREEMTEEMNPTRDYERTAGEYKSNNNSNSLKWGFITGFEIHQTANKNGLKFNNITDTEILEILDDATVKVDEFQDAKYSYMHAMTNAIVKI